MDFARLVWGADGGWVSRGKRVFRVLGMDEREKEQGGGKWKGF